MSIETNWEMLFSSLEGKESWIDRPLCSNKNMHIVGSVRIFYAVHLDYKSSLRNIKRILLLNMWIASFPHFLYATVYLTKHKNTRPH